ncbi:hypothetical protein F5887DRAFT_1075581 [Amanita rubescens]|nr:hypothetical protein F5887DRAFT_1082413 [Amanita rubescens]KAF8343700.1 hypothetical protein F5887DRAFT_1075581 [Amanita rubescens]
MRNIADQNAIHRSYNSYRGPDQRLLLHPHGQTAQPVNLPSHGYWAGGITPEKIYTANAEQIDELLDHMGLTDIVALLPEGNDRRLYLILDLGIQVPGRN